jgi:hypothetical protein
MTESTPESWIPIPGYEGSYEVSDLGRVRSLDRIVRGGNGGMRLSPGGMRKVSSRADGRRFLNLRSDGKGVIRLVPHLVLEAFVGPRPDRHDACHNNGDPADDRLVNLRWDSRSENMYDMVRHGRHAARNKDVCPRDHPLVLPNLIRIPWEKNGFRNCLACCRARASRQEAARRGLPFDLRKSADEHFRKLMGEYY